MARQTVGRRRDYRRAANWLGREELVTRIDNLLNNEPLYNVLNIWGLGGIGKSTLLKTISERLAARGVTALPCSIEMADTPIRILHSWRRASKLEDFRFDRYDRLAKRASADTRRLGLSASGISASLVEAVDDAEMTNEAQSPVKSEIEIAEVSRSLGDDSLLTSDGLVTQLTNEFLSACANMQTTPLVLMIDTYDQATLSVNRWLRELLISSEDFLDTFVLIVAGRDPLPNIDSSWRSYWGEILWEVEVDPLSATTSAAYLDRRGVPANDIPRLARIADGLPLALELLADIHDVSGPVALSDTSTESAHAIIVEALLRQLSGKDPELLTLALAASALESFDLDLLQFVAATGSHESLDRIRKFSFVRTLPTGQMGLHEIVRRHVAALVRTTNPNQWQDCCGRASEAYERRLKSTVAMSTEWFAALRGMIFSLLGQGPERATAVLARLPLRVPPAATLEVESLLRLAEREVPAIAGDGRFLLAKAQSQYASNDLSSAMSTLAQVLARAEEQSTRLRARLLKVEIHHRTGNVQGALDEAVEGIRAEPLLDAATLALLQVRISEMSASLGSLEDSLQSSAEAESSLQSVSEPDLRAYVGLHLSYVNIFRGDYASSRRSLTFAMEAGRQISDAYAVAHSDSSYAWLCSLDGHFEAAWTSGLRALQSFWRQKDPYGLGLASLSRSEVLRNCLDFRAALAWNRYAERSFTRADSALYLAITELQMGSCYYALHKYQSAQKVLRRALARQEVIQEFATKGMILYWLSQLELPGTTLRSQLIDEAMQDLSLGGYYARAFGELLSLVQSPPSIQVPDHYINLCTHYEFFDLLGHGYVVVLDHLTDPGDSISEECIGLASDDCWRRIAFISRVLCPENGG